MCSPTKRRRHDAHAACLSTRLTDPVSPSESAPDDQFSASDGDTRCTDSPELSPLLTRAMTVDMDLLPLVDVDLPDLPQPSDTAAFERLPHVQMPLDGAPLDEARLGIGEELEMIPRSEGLEILRMSSGVKVELQALTKGELLGYPLDAIPPSRDSSLETLVLPPSPRDNDNDDDEVHEAVLGELLDSQADWPSHPRSPPPPQYDEAFLHKHARWQDALRAALAKADGYTRSLVGAAAANSPCGTMVVLARISPRQIAALHPPARELVQQLLDITRVHAAFEHSSLDPHAFELASLSSSSSTTFSFSETTSPSLSPPSSSSYLDGQVDLSLLKREIA